MMKKTFLLFWALLFVCINVFAQANTEDMAVKRGLAKALATQVMQTQNLDESFERMIDPTIKGLVDTIKQANTHLNAQQLSRIDQLLGGMMRSEMNAVMRKVMPAMMEATEKIYADRFSIAELEELSRFMNSPVGKKSQSVMLKELPQTMQPMMGEFGQIGQTVAKKTIDIFTQLEKEGIRLNKQ
jgi:hypothetical protein